MKVNLQKFIADCGYCARRKAGDLIKAGRVKVNGKLAELGMKVDEKDKVEVFDENHKKNEILKKNKDIVCIKLNKPVGYTCTNRKFKGERNIFDLLKSVSKKGVRLFVAGRLDKNSRGLVLLTNDGDFAQKLTHPRFGHEKEYLVATDKIKNSDIKIILEKFRSGINIGDRVVKAKKIEYLKDNKFSIILTTGKKRQIREMFKMCGYRTKDLKRVRIANLKLGNLEEGAFEFLDKKDINISFKR